MWTEIVRIIHVTDMHLFVDTQGNFRSFQERAVSIILAASVPGLGKGVHHHSRRALKALLSTLETITAPPTGKLLLVQSGDLETYGAKRPTGTSSVGWSFPGFDYWEQETRKRLPQVDTFIDLYGNHDVWPGAHPLSPFARLNIKEAERTLRTTRQTFDLPMPHHDTIVDVSPYRLEVYRLNTVQTGLLTSTLAHGKIDSDVWLTYRAAGVYPFSNHDNPITEIIALAQQANVHNPHQQAIRLLVMCILRTTSSPFQKPRTEKAYIRTAHSGEKNGGKSGPGSF